MAVREVAAVGQVHRQVGVARLEQRHQHGHVGLAAAVGLDVGRLAPEQLLRAIARQPLDRVDVLAAAVVAPSGVALGVLVRHHRGHRLTHRARAVVLRQQCAVLSHAFSAGVTVPEPICLCENVAILGSVFFIMRCTSGLAAGHKLAKDPVFKQGSKQLGAQLGYEMAKLQLAPSSPALDALPAPSPLSPQQQQLREMRGYLDVLGTGQPVLEYALNWLEDRLDIWQTDEAKVLCHRDFRTGNFLVEGEAMTALLDWEFAGFSDRHEDIGWLCARCWRFGNPHLTVGGLAPFAAFQQAYEKAYGQPIHLLAMACWQVMAEIRWAVIALQQANRNDSGAEYSLQLALSGQMVPEMEYHMLSLIEEIDQNKWQDYRQ